MTVIALVLIVALWLYVNVAWQTYRTIIARPDVQAGMRELDENPGYYTSAHAKRLAIAISISWPWTMLRALMRERARR